MWCRLNIFIWTFLVLRKSFFSSWPCKFSSKYFYPNPGWCFQLIFIIQLSSFTKKACKFAIKRYSNIFLEFTKRREHLQSNALDKLRFSNSDSLLLKLKTIPSCFELDIFHNNLKDNVYGQVFSYKYFSLLLK